MRLLPLFLVLASFGLLGYRMHDAYACTPTDCSVRVVTWLTGTPWPSSTTRDGEGNFSLNQSINWCGYPTAPFIGVFDVTASSQDIGMVNFAPAYIFPPAEFGGVSLTVSGNASGSGPDTFTERVQMFQNTPAQTCSREITVN